MAVGTALAAVSIGATVATTGMSFAQMSRARNEQVKAQEHAQKAIQEARKRLEVNFYDGLSIMKEPYELEREALLNAGAQSMEAARESQRGVAATAGRLQMAQNENQGQIRTAMGQELMGLEKLSAQEDSRLRDINVLLDKEEAAGAQLATANAWEMEQKALQNAMAGVSSLANQAASLAPLYPKKGTSPNPQNPVAPTAQNNVSSIDVNNIDVSQPLPMQFEGRNINPLYQGKPLQDIIVELQGTGALSPNMNEIDYGQLYNMLYI
jgi:hypothetical protein